MISFSKSYMTKIDRLYLARKRHLEKMRLCKASFVLVLFKVCATQLVNPPATEESIRNSKVFNIFTIVQFKNTGCTSTQTFT